MDSYFLSSRPSEARAGTHTPQPTGELRKMGPRLRGDGGGKLCVDEYHLTPPPTSAPD